MVIGYPVDGDEEIRENRPYPTKEFWRARKAQWSPVYWDHSGVHGSVIDWTCPQCNKSIHADHTNIRRCPHCGLNVGQQPVFRQTFPRAVRNREWLAWYFAEVDDEPVESLRRKR